MTLLGPTGKPIKASDYAQRGRPKAKRPVIGEAHGIWAGRPENTGLPGFEALQFDATRLTIADYRKMGEHYQINSSLLVLSFMMHQLDYKIVCEDKAVQAQAEENLRNIWTRLVRAMCQSFQYGYSPNVLQWENGKRYLEITKVKDLLHEECSVNWKFVDGPKVDDKSVPRKFKIYDGIHQWGYGVIGKDNSFWYPLLMKYGDYGGTKLLRTAYQPWFFSSLIHLYQNRYFERFGEPVPIGRAPYDERITVGDDEYTGAELMTTILGMIRNRAAVTLPNDTTPNKSGTGDKYDYTVEYLESQMRGADFERYLTRLDEEMSLALFTPLLLLRTADSGGYNQGIAHTKVFMWMLNAIAEDWAEYINKYILAPIARFNFGGDRAPLPKIQFRKLGMADQELIRGMVQEMLRSGKAEPELDELGQHAGISLKKIAILKEKTGPEPDTDPRIVRDRSDSGPDSGGTEKIKASAAGIKVRLSAQINRAVQGDTLDIFKSDVGYYKKVLQGCQELGYTSPHEEAIRYLKNISEMVDDSARAIDWKSGDEFSAYVSELVDMSTEKLCAGV